MSHTTINTHHMHGTGLLKTSLLFIACILTFTLITSCGDERVVPAQDPDPAHTETIVLWTDQMSGGNQISASFTVDDNLAPIVQPGTDHPARLTVVGYITPDADIIRYEEIRFDSLPYVNGKVITYQSILEALQERLDSLFSIDTAFAAHGCSTLVCSSCPCAIYTDSVWCDIDTCGSAGLRAAVQIDTAIYMDTLSVWLGEKARLEAERDQKAALVDNRYRLALWFDDPNASPVYPEAVFAGLDSLENQQIYLAETDTTSNRKGRGFSLNMDNIRAADPLPENLGFTYEVNWTTCFAGSTNPCLSPGTHTIYARLSGAAATWVTGTIVLVYAGERP